MKPGVETGDIFGKFLKFFKRRDENKNTGRCQKKIRKKESIFVGPTAQIGPTCWERSQLTKKKKNKKMAFYYSQIRKREAWLWRRV